MSLVQIDWNPEKKQLRRFGVAMIILCELAGWLFASKGHFELGLGIFIFGVLSCLSGFIHLGTAKVFYRIWMALGYVMGLVIAPIMFAVMYYLCVTPIALLGKLVGRDRLNLKKNDGDSYWHDMPPTPDIKRYERQF